MFEAMQHFVAAVETGSFSQAGQRLQRNASSVARQVDRLEQMLGTKLLQRSTRQLELTLEGQAFYMQSLDILRAVDEARQSCSNTDADVTGQVAITAFDSFGRDRVVPLLPAFYRQYPQSRIVISLDNNVVDLHDGPFDIAIRFGKPVDSSLIMKSLIRDSAVLVASPAYLQARPAILQPEDLRGHTCLTLYRQRQHTYWYFRQAEARHKLRIEGTLSACGGEPLVRWLLDGVGICLISRWFVAPYLASGELVEILPTWQAGLSDSNEAEVYLLWKAQSARRPVVRAMIDFLTTRLREATAG